MPVILKQPKVIILDIEGTTTSIRFVSEKLFPAIRANLREYLQIHWNSSAVQVTVDKLIEQFEADRRDRLKPPKIRRSGTPAEQMEQVAKNVLWQMEHQRKNDALKQIQILVWVFVYESDKLQGHVFEDVVECMKKWTKLSIRIFIYSSGLVTAQQLLLAKSTHGNLHEFISEFVDSTIGPKTDPKSYKAIAKRANVLEKDILFLTDTAREAEAATKAGCRAVLVYREHNTKPTEEEKQKFGLIESFHDLQFHQ